jgi:hypothetical protein
VSQEGLGQSRCGGTPMAQQATDEHLSPNVSLKTRGKTALILGLVIGLLVAAWLAIPLLVNQQTVKNALVREVEQRTGHRLVFEDLELRLLPRPRLDLHHVKVFEPQSEAPLLSAKHLDVALQVAPLLEGRAVAAHVVIESPRITVRRAPSGQWTIGEGNPKTASDKKKGDPLGFLAFMRNLLIVDGGVMILDQSGSIQTDPVHLASLQVTMTEDIPGRSAKIQVSGEMPQGSAGSALLNIDGSLVVLNGVGEEPADAGVSVQAEGTVRIHRLDVPHVAGVFGLLPVPAGSAPPVQLVGHLRVVPRPAGYDLIVTDWRAGFSDVSLQGTATVMGLGTALPRVSASLSSSSVPLKQTLKQVPAEWIPADVRDKLSEHAVEGFISAHDTHVEGVLGQTEGLHIAGVVEIRDGRFVPGGTHPAVRDVSATVIYDLKQIQVTGLRGNYGPVRFSEGTVLITEWKQDPMIDVRISGDVRAADLIALLSNRGLVPQLVADLSQLEQVTGEVGMVAHLAGQPGRGDLDLEDMSVTIRNGGFRHQAVAVPFRQVQASVTISPTELRLDRLSGQAGFARVEGGGKVTLAGEPSFHGVTLNVTADGADLAPWLQQASGQQFRPAVQGPIFLNTSISGAVRTPRFHGRLTMDGAGLDIPHVFAKAKGAPAGIRFEGEVRDNLLLAVRRCELIFPPVRLTGEGRIHLSDNWEFRARIRSDALSLENLPRGVTLGPVREGVLKAGLKMEGKVVDRASWVTNGRLSFDNGVIEGQFQDPIRNLAVKLRFDGKNIDIRRLAFTVGDSDVRLSGSIADWLEVPRAKVVVESSQIDFQSLRLAGSNGSSSSSDAFPVMRTWWADGSLEATILVDYAYYERTLLSGLSCRVRFEHGTLTIDRISGDTDDGHLGGRIVLNMSERSRRTVRSALHVSGLPVERLFSLMDDRRRISGWMAAKGGIQAEFGQERVFRSTINSRRPITVVIERGRIFYSPVISKVLSLMNLPALLRGKADLTEDGMPLDRLKAVFGVEDGIINIREFLLDSPVLKISGTGRYDFIDDKFDAVVVVSPLGQYSELLKSVPLFGKLFAGERQGFDTAIFEVKGPAKDPNVVYLPAESLMAGAKGTAKLAFDLLVNAITLPKEAFSMADDSPAEDDEVQEGARGS